MASGFDTRHVNDMRGLVWVHLFGWLRSLELGRLMWPNDPFARSRADRVVRQWIKRRLVIVRRLPDGAGRALVVAETGAGLLREAKKVAFDRKKWGDATENWQHDLLTNVAPATGKDWGETDRSGWRPPQCWRHELLVAGALTLLIEQGFSILPDKQIRRENPGLTKVPDGIAWKKDGPIYWIEVENARKTGQSQKTLAQALCLIAGDSSVTVSGMSPTEPMVAYTRGGRDDRGLSIDHRLRVTNGIQKVALRDMQITWAECTLAGCGVGRLSLQRTVICSDRARRILYAMNTNGWTEIEEGDEAGCFVATYNGIKAFIWDDLLMGWSYQIDDGKCAEQANSKTEAKQGCAKMFASLSN